MDQVISPGDKIVQFILTPIIKAKLIECQEESEVFPAQSERGSGGFGSTGTN
jgi:dUTPase